MIRAITIAAMVTALAVLAAEARVIDVPQPAPAPAPAPPPPPPLELPQPMQPPALPKVVEPTQQEPKQPTTTQQQFAPDNRGTEQAPLIAKTIPEQRSAQETKRAEEKAKLDRESVNLTRNLVDHIWLLFLATTALAAVHSLLPWSRSFKCAKDCELLLLQKTRPMRPAAPRVLLVQTRRREGDGGRRAGH